MAPLLLRLSPVVQRSETADRAEALWTHGVLELLGSRKPPEGDLHTRFVRAHF